MSNPEEEDLSWLDTTDLTEPDTEETLDSLNPLEEEHQPPPVAQEAFELHTPQQHTEKLIHETILTQGFHPDEPLGPEPEENPVLTLDTTAQGESFAASDFCLPPRGRRAVHILDLQPFLLTLRQ